jgi:hypothetical protein
VSQSASRIGDDFADKPQCADDFKNTTNDVAKLTHVGFANLGTPTFSDNNGVEKWVKGLDGRYNPITGNITLNNQINWSNPSQTPDIFNGQPGTYDALAAEAAYLGIASVSAAQLMDIVLLHELAHYNGTIGNPDKQAVELQIWNDCIK